MSEHKRASVIASAKSGMWVGTGNRMRGINAKLAKLVGIGVFVLLALALLTVYLVHRNDMSPAHKLHVQIKALQTQIKASQGDPTTQLSLYQQLAVVCAKAGDTKCANDADSKAAAIQGPNSPGGYVGLAQTAQASGDKQKAIGYYNKAIQSIRDQSGGEILPFDQRMIDNIQAQINVLEGQK